MVLAAGFGLRMRPLTNKTPKPLLHVGGIPMIERILVHLVDAGIRDVVINTHYLANQFFAYFDGRENPNIKIIFEQTLLDTGGGVANALPFLAGNAFLVLNSDIVILNGKQPLIQRLAETWNPNAMDALLLLQPVEKSFGYSGPGDFHLQTNGLLRRRTEKTYAPFLFTGIQMLKRTLFQAVPNLPFSLNLLYNRALEHDRLFGVVHDGDWIHVGTPDAMKKAKIYIRDLE
jgi:MurNAc alpha-1-phosphate uridylyltransferase